MVKSSVDKKGAKTVFKGAWRDHMRRPRVLKITVEDAVDLEPQVVFETEQPQHMFQLFASIAELAWSMGWRPRGLSGVVKQLIDNYKEPAPE